MIKCAILFGMVFLQHPESDTLYNASHFAKFRVSPCGWSGEPRCVMGDIPGYYDINLGRVPEGSPRNVHEILLRCEADAVAAQPQE